MSDYRDIYEDLRNNTISAIELFNDAQVEVRNTDHRGTSIAALLIYLIQRTDELENRINGGS